MKKRDYGIDLLRIFAMGFIVMFHLLNHGGMRFAFPALSTSGILMHLLAAFVCCAVNAYALVSGYVMVRAPFRLSRLIGLWMQVVFYGLAAVALVSVVKPGSLDAAEALADAVLPVTRDSYWYFTAYAVVFALSPFLNLLVQHLSKQQACLMSTVLVLVFCLLPMFEQNETLQLLNGYHAGWLLILYVLGACIRLHGIPRLPSKKISLMVYGLCSLIAWGSWLAFTAANAAWEPTLLLHYVSPTTLLSSMCLLSFFREMKLSQRACRVIAHVAPLTFGVYLIHDNALIREHFVKMRMIGLAQLNPVMMLGGLFLCWAGIYAACLLIEWLRFKLFDWLKIPAICERMENQLTACANRLFPGADA